MRDKARRAAIPGDFAPAESLIEFSCQRPGTHQMPQLIPIRFGDPWSTDRSVSASINHGGGAPNDFTHLADVEARIHAFAHLYQTTATPFEWKFTRRDLADLLDRLTQDETAAAA